MADAADFTLYTAATCNGWKPIIVLEELGLRYRLRRVALEIGEHRKPPLYPDILPAKCIPALVDHRRNDLRLTQSGAILWYLVQHYDPDHLLWPEDTAGQAEAMCWLFFTASDLAPVEGQAYRSVHYAPVKDAVGVRRCVNETLRLYEVLEARLKVTDWLAGGQYTFADIAAFIWVLDAPLIGIDVDALFPSLARWRDRIFARPAVLRALDLPDENPLKAARLEESGKQLQRMIQDGKAVFERAEHLLRERDASHGMAAPAAKEDVPTS